MLGLAKDSVKAALASRFEACRCEMGKQMDSFTLFLSISQPTTVTLRGEIWYKPYRTYGFGRRWEMDLQYIASFMGMRSPALFIFMCLPQISYLRSKPQQWFASPSVLSTVVCDASPY